MNSARKRVQPFGDFLRMLIAPAIWFAHFSFLYAAEALICIGPPAGRDPTMGSTILLATAAALSSLLIFGVGTIRAKNAARLRASQQPILLSAATLLLTLLSGLGIIWTLLPALVLPVCALSGALQR